MKRKTIVTLTLLVLLLISMVGTVAAEGIDDPTETPEVETSDTVEEPEGEVEEGEVEEGEAEEDVVTTGKFFTHPVVQILSAYFDRDWDPNAVVEDEAGETPEGETPEGETPEGETPEGETPEGETPEGETPESGLGPIGEQIATLHEEGMGFGVLVKIFAIAEAAKECAPVVPAEGDAPAADAPAGEEPACVYVTAEELVAAVKGGEGMGQLFKTYGKPAMLGVGHVKKAVKKMQNPVEEPPVVEPVVEPVVDEQMLTGNGKPDKGNAGNNGKAPKVKTNNGKGPNK